MNGVCLQERGVGDVHESALRRQSSFDSRNRDGNFRFGIKSL
jgi:hypothetical protein